MMPASPETAWLYSPLAEDPDLRDIVDLFVAELPQRVQNVLDRFQTRDWDGLRRTAHQLKGAAGSYGFEPITPAAARVEDAVARRCPEEELSQAVSELVMLCGRARGGVP
jgi:histidine phosphotransfer protein HptB